MSESSLKKITINELTPGMYVQSIIEQKGSVKIKSQGKVLRQSVVDALKKRGVKKLVIDLSKQFVPENDESRSPDSVDTDTPPSVNKIKEPSAEKVSFQEEVSRATMLHKQGKKIQKQLLNAVKQGLPFEDKVPREFSQNLVSSIDRNPDALLCLTKIREKDEYLLEHSLNVAILLANFARFTGMSDDEVNDLAYAGFLHDIGKIRIPDSILHKPGKLTDMEMNVMREHVYYGVRVLEEVKIPTHLVRTVSEHHERLDGYGYPNGARGDEISQAGRMLAIADVYDALTADRCYKAGMPSQKALQILMNDAPHKLDKALVQQFVRCMGVYPVGSLVKLNNERIAMVMAQTSATLSPKIKVFYSARGSHFLEPKDVDLSTDTTVKIEKAVKASDYRIDVKAFFDRCVNV